MRFAASTCSATTPRRSSSRCSRKSAPRPARRLLELGCGPGFYACRLAEELPHLETTGIDLSPKLIERAKWRARTMHLPNCTFRDADAHHLPYASDSIDAVVVSRLFLIVPDKEGIVSEILSRAQAGRTMLHRGADLRLPHTVSPGRHVAAGATHHHTRRQVSRASAGRRHEPAGLRSPGAHPGLGRTGPPIRRAGTSTPSAVSRSQAAWRLPHERCHAPVPGA